MKNIHEYEIKILGKYSSLTKAFNKVSRISKPISKYHYRFPTTYFDDANRTLYKQGYSLRYRPNQLHFKASIELKQIQGEEKGVSKRVEIGIKDDLDTLSLYFCLLVHPSIPSGVIIPPYNSLIPIYSIVTDRYENSGIINVKNKPIVIESALDDIDYICNNEVIGHDSELEIEIKDSNSIDCRDLLEFSKNNITNSIEGLIYSTQSKVSRLNDFLIDK